MRCEGGRSCGRLVISSYTGRARSQKAEDIGCLIRLSSKQNPWKAVPMASPGDGP